MLTFAPRTSRFKPSPSSAASARARDLRAAGRDIISLTAGEPDFPTPDNVKQAAIRAMERNETKYTNTDGAPELKAAVQAKFKRENGLDYGLDQILIGNGAKQIIFDAIMATVASGDEVIVPAPYWVSYPDMVRLAGGAPVIVNGPQNNGFKVRAEDLDAAITPNTKWLVLNSPNNPTGAAYSRDELIELGEVVLEHSQICIMTDDIYEHLLFDGGPFSTPAQALPALYDRTLTINGVSKAYSMTGWRIGYAGGPKELIREMVKVQSQSTSSAGSISQAAAVEALNGPQDFLEERRESLRQRRDVMAAALNACDGLICDTPPGGMYVFCSCAGVIGKRTPDGKTIENDRDFTMYLLDSANVAVVQGEAYGMSPYFRASFPIATELLEEAGRRIQKACAALR